MKQEKIIVLYCGQEDNEIEVNNLLADGWSVKMVAPMSGAGAGYSHAVIVLVKD